MLSVNAGSEYINVCVAQYDDYLSRRVASLFVL